MTQIVVDFKMRQKLLEVPETVQIIDESGIVLGAFLPLRQPPYDPSLIPPMDETESDRLDREPGMFTTEQVLDRLRSL